MAVLDQVVVGLGPVRVSREASALAQACEASRPAGDELVHIGLVPGVPDDAVRGGLEHPVQGERELDHSEVRPQVTAGAGTLEATRNRRISATSAGQLLRVHGCRGRGRRQVVPRARFGRNLGDGHADQCVLTRARRDWRSEPRLAITAEGS